MTCKNAAIRVQLQRPNGHRIKKVFVVFGLLLSGLAVSGQDRRQIWIDSVFQRLTLPEKIGQLFMVRLSATTDRGAITDLSDQIKDWHIGGIQIMHGGAKSTANLINRLQPLNKVPLLTGIRASTGLGESLDSTLQFFKPAVLSSVRNDSLVYQVGESVARQMKLLGLHVNFGLNTTTWHQENNYEDYFSDNKIRVARKSLNLVHGLQDHGIIACPIPVLTPPGKQPDGRDSVIVFDRTRLDTTELHTTLKLIASGMGALLTNSFRYSLLENKKPTQASQSSFFLTDLLPNELGFHGLTFYELPEVTKPLKGEKKRKKGALEVDAIMAGNQVLIGSKNIGSAVKLIQKSIRKNAGLMQRVDAAVKKILETKYDAGLSHARRLDTDNLLLKLNTPEDQLLQYHLAEAAVTVVRNVFTAIPVRILQDKKFISLSVGRGAGNEFSHYLGKYAGFEKLEVKNVNDTVGLALKLKPADVLVVGIYPEGTEWSNHLLPILQVLAAHKEVILCFFGNPQAVNYFPGFPSVMTAYHDDDLIQKAAAEIIFGGLTGHGSLPFTLATGIREGHGLVTPSLGRLSWSIPEAAGMDSKTLEQIVSIANEAIDMRATPGCEVLVARHGKIVYEKPVGYLTYDKKAPVTDETLYDLASVTKVSATLQTVMFMYEKGLIDINKKASVYMPELRNSNKKDFTIKDILTHQAGLWPFVPFWAQTVRDTLRLPEYYARKGSPEYPYPVSSNLYSSRGMKDSLVHWIVKAKIVEKNNRMPFDYRYSDMGFFLFLHLAERMLNQPMEQFLEQNFYDVLGASTTGYLPLLKYPASRIAPTEDDKLFRHSQLTGYVHDQMAAMNGGVAGHAGLFSTANDLAKLGQMWLQKGTYAGHRYFKSETVNLFTRKQFENSRRGLGWDKPTVSDPNGPTSAYASAQTFGHTGFTGISIWVDPEFDLVFIFFSNRVYPEMTNNKILNANIRPRVQDVVYRSIFNYCSNHN